MTSHSMELIKQKVLDTIGNLTEKRNLLQKDRESYMDLKSKLNGLDKGNGLDQTKVTVNFNSNSRLRKKTSDSAQDRGSFDDEDPVESQSIINERIQLLDDGIKEFNQKIEEAHKTIENIDELIQFDNESREVEESEKSKGAKGEEEFQFMEIREELDEDGNVISSSVQPQNTKALDSFAKKTNESSLDANEDELQELLKDMEVILNSEQKSNGGKITEIKGEDSDDDFDLFVKERTVINKTKKIVNPEPKQPYNEPKQLKSILKTTTKKDPIDTKTQPFNKETKTENTTIELKKPAVESEYESLLREMGIVSISSSEPKPQPTPTETTRITPAAKEQDTEEPSFTPSIDQDDILQLQIIDTELDDLIEDDDDEEINLEELGIDVEDDEDDDWDFEITEDNLIPGPHKDLFLAELNKLRADNGQSVGQIEEIKEEEVEIMNEEKEQTECKVTKKSVVFAETLEEVKEIENVSQLLKEAGNAKVSKFKLARGLFSSFTPSSNSVTEMEGSAVNQLIVEKDVIVEENIVATSPVAQESRNAVSDFIVEKDVDSHPIIEESSKPKKQSRFKSSMKPTKTAPVPVVEVSNGEKPVEVKDTPKPQRLSKFKSSLSSLSRSGPKPTIPANKIPIEKDIIEVENTIPIEPQQYIPRVIHVPEGEATVNSDFDFESIKEYVNNEEEEIGDEELLNSLTDDISVYRGEDEDEEDDYDEDDDDYGPMVLDEIVENEDVDDPDYFVNDNLLKKEYHDLRRKMIEKYLNNDGGVNTKDTIIIQQEEGDELEPIDENGNPIKVSRFRKSLEKK